jgi:hypothetical protein
VKSADVDTSGFQNIVLMLVGVLMIMLISNVLTIISNPDNIKIGALVTGTVYEEEGETGEGTFIPPKFQNMEKNPVYVEVRAHRLIVYPELIVVSESDLRLPDNGFEKFLKDLQPLSSSRYIVLLLRPDCALFQRKIRRVIQDYNIDVGFEPWDASRTIRVAGLTDLAGNVYGEDGQIEAPEGEAAAPAAEESSSPDGQPSAGQAPAEPAQGE